MDAARTPDIGRATAWTTPSDGPPAGRAELEAAVRAEGAEPSWWGNGPGDTYAAHEHGYHKVLYCAVGGIVFHTDGGDLALRAGDRLDLTPGTRHRATVGPDGVECVEGAVHRPA